MGGSRDGRGKVRGAAMPGGQSKERKAAPGRTPKLRFHKASGRYFVVIQGRWLYLGTDLAEARAEYHRMMLDLAVGCPPAGAGELLVCEVVERYLADREVYYKEHPESFTRGRLALGVLVRFYGDVGAGEFSLRDLRAFRAHLVGHGTSSEVERQGPITRRQVNAYVREVVRMWRWAASLELAPPEVYGACLTLEPLKAGRSEALERAPVGPVDLKHVEAVRKLVNRSVRALIDLQLLTGARAGELVGLRAVDIDRTGPVWRVVLAKHKTAHHGRGRALYFGPKAQKVLRPLLLLRDPGEFLFQPMDHWRERSARASQGRRQKQADTPRVTARRVGKRYDTASYRKAIQRACLRAEVTVWHPHQLRHTAATALRARYGLEAARAVLGHTSVAVTAIYAEMDQAVSEKVAREVG